jgi:hypothetical protein
MTIWFYFAPSCNLLDEIKSNLTRAMPVSATVTNCSFV